MFILFILLRHKPCSSWGRLFQNLKKAIIFVLNTIFFIMLKPKEKLAKSEKDRKKEVQAIKAAPLRIAKIRSFLLFQTSSEQLIDMTNQYAAFLHHTTTS